MSGIIDSRDLIEEADGLREVIADGHTLLPEDAERLAAIDALADEVGGDWPYGVALIPEDCFEDYARELAEDIGALPSEHTWPTSYIDWERAADELAMDYTTVEFDGTTYYVRP